MTQNVGALIVQLFIYTYTPSSPSSDNIYFNQDYLTLQFGRQAVRFSRSVSASII